MIERYPYTDFHSMNLDYLIRLAHESMGLHLVVEDDKLKLLNANGDTVSAVTIAYAEKALKDVNGHDIDAYILNAGVNGRYLALTRGDGSVVTLTIPYAETAEKDVNNRDITSYVRGVGISGNKLLVTFGDNTTYSFTVPFATDARNDKNGKDITTYVAGIRTTGDNVVIVDGAGNTIGELTIAYATSALNDEDGDAIKATYGASLTAGTTTVILRNKNGDAISEITVPYATKALKDGDGNTIVSSYGHTLGVNGTKIGLIARDGSTLNEITVPFANASQDANNAIESVSISGDTIVFTTYGGQSITITSPYAVKALKDDLNNTLSHAYIASVQNDAQTGDISFYAQDGTLIATLTPTVDSAVHDNYGNDIADFILSIVTSANSNYVTVTHGNGDVDSLTINYSTTAWKDTYGNIIGNVYVKRLTAGTDPQTGKPVIIAYNGEGSELFRFSIEAQATTYAETAEKDINGNDITDYVNDVSVSGHTMTVTHGDGTTDSVSLPNDSVTMRYRNNAFNDGWLGDNDEFENDPYPFIIELVDSNNNVISKEPMPTTISAPVDIHYYDPIPAHSSISNYVDLPYIETNWERIYGRHHSCIQPEVTHIINQNPEFLINIVEVTSIPTGEGSPGIRIYYTIHNCTASSETPIGSMQLYVDYGQATVYPNP